MIQVVIQDAADALADLRVLLDSPLATRPTRERLLARAIAYLEVAAKPAEAQPPGDGRREDRPDR